MCMKNLSYPSAYSLPNNTALSSAYVRVPLMSILNDTLKFQYAHIYVMHNNFTCRERFLSAILIPNYRDHIRVKKHGLIISVHSLSKPPSGAPSLYTRTQDGPDWTEIIISSKFTSRWTTISILCRSPILQQDRLRHLPAVISAISIRILQIMLSILL